MRDDYRDIHVADLPPGWRVQLHTTSNMNAEIERELVASNGTRSFTVDVGLGRRATLDAGIEELRDLIAESLPCISVIYLDVDEVLVDWVGDALHGLGYDADAVMRDWAQMNPRPRNLFDVIGVDPAVMWSHINDHDAEFWAKLKPFPWMQDLLALCRDFAPTVLVTSPAPLPACHAGKAQWMQDTFGADFRDYALTSVKHRFAHPGALLIDDSPKNCAAFREHGGHAILFPGVGNDLHAIPGDERVAYVREQLKGYRR